MQRIHSRHARGILLHARLARVLLCVHRALPSPTDLSCSEVCPYYDFSAQHPLPLATRFWVALFFLPTCLYLVLLFAGLFVSGADAQHVQRVPGKEGGTAVRKLKRGAAPRVRHRSPLNGPLQCCCCRPTQHALSRQAQARACSSKETVAIASARDLPAARLFRLLYYPCSKVYLGYVYALTLLPQGVWRRTLLHVSTTAVSRLCLHCMGWRLEYEGEENLQASGYVCTAREARHARVDSPEPG